MIVPRSSQRVFDSAQLDPRLRADLIFHATGGGSGNTWFDRSGYGNNGTLTNGPIWTLGEGGKRNAVSFDGSNDYVDYGDVTFLDGKSSWSISAWFRVPDTTGRYGIVSKWRDDVAQRGILIEVFSGNIRFFKGTTGTGNTFLTTAATANDWTHVVALQNGVDVVLYVNGVERVRAANTHALADNTESLLIGVVGIAGVLSGYFRGSIDDVRIYGRALSAAEVALLAAPSFVPVTTQRALFGKRAAIAASGYAFTGRFF